MNQPPLSQVNHRPGRNIKHPPRNHGLVGDENTSDRMEVFDMNGGWDFHLPQSPTRCPSSLAKLVQITLTTMIYCRYIMNHDISIVSMVYKPTYHLERHHPAEISLQPAIRATGRLQLLSRLHLQHHLADTCRHQMLGIMRFIWDLQGDLYGISMGFDGNSSS